MLIHIETHEPPVNHTMVPPQRPQEREERDERVKVRREVKEWKRNGGVREREKKGLRVRERKTKNK